MRKGWILWMTAVILAVCGMAGLQMGVVSASQVRWQRLNSQGDSSCIGNLNISLDDCPIDQQIHWISRWRPGEEALVEHQIQERSMMDSTEEESGNRAFMDLPMDSFTSGTDLVKDAPPEVDEWYDSWYRILYPALKELADTTKPGSWGEGSYPVREYAGDIGGQFYTDFNSRYHLNGDNQSITALKEASNQIRFQVPEDAVISVRLFKDDKGKVSDLEYSCHPKGQTDSYGIYSEGILTPYGVYLMIAPERDFLPEEGRGIYQIPYSYSEETGFVCQSPRQVIKLGERETGIRLQVSENGEVIHLIYQRDGKTWLDLYDSKNSQLQQTLLLSEKEEEYAEWIRMDEKAQVITFDGGAFVSLGRENGPWEKVGTANLYETITSIDDRIPKDEDGIYDVYPVSAALLGNRTAIAYHCGRAAGGLCVYQGNEPIYTETFATDIWSEYGSWPDISLEWEE